MTYEQKYEKLTEGKKRPLPGMIWLKNDGMTAKDPENPVLIQVHESQFVIKNSPFVKQGYERYVYSKPVAPPVEAKKKQTEVQ